MRSKLRNAKCDGLFIFLFDPLIHNQYLTASNSMNVVNWSHTLFYLQTGRKKPLILNRLSDAISKSGPFFYLQIHRCWSGDIYSDKAVTQKPHCYIVSPYHFGEGNESRMLVKFPTYLFSGFFSDEISVTCFKGTNLQFWEEKRRILLYCCRLLQLDVLVGGYMVYNGSCLSFLFTFKLFCFLFVTCLVDFYLFFLK